MKPIKELLPKIKIVILCCWAWFIVSSIIYAVSCWFGFSDAHNRLFYIIIGIIINALISFLLSITNLNRMSIRLIYQIKHDKYTFKQFYWWYQAVMTIVFFFLIIGFFALHSKSDYSFAISWSWWISLCFCLWYWLINLTFIFILFKIFNREKNKNII